MKIDVEMGLQLRPVGGASVRLTGPVRPLTSAIVTVTVTDEPVVVGDGYEVVIRKSGGVPKVSVAVVVWVIGPLVAVMFNV